MRKARLFAVSVLLSLTACGGGWSDADFNGAVQYCTGFGLPTCFQRATFFEEAGCPLEEFYVYVDRLAESGSDTSLLNEKAVAEHRCSDE